MTKLILTLALLIWIIPNGLHAQVDSTEKFVLLEYGFPSDDDYASVKAKISKKWNIYHKSVAGCIVSDRLVDSVRIFNENTFQRLADKYGADWNDRYSKEIADACKEHTVVLDRLKIDTVLRKSADYSELIINNSDFNSLTVMTYSKSLPKEEFFPITVDNMQDDYKDVIYRGFRNHFEINLGNSRTSYFHLECINCKITTIHSSDTLPAHQYFIRPTRGKEAILNIYSEKEILHSDTFAIRNLPDPEIHINGIPNGEKLPLEQLDSTLTIEVRYLDNITLRSEFQVESWVLSIAGKSAISGSGYLIDKHQLRSFKAQSSKDRLPIICTVRGPDGVLRKKAGVFVLE